MPGVTVTSIGEHEILDGDRGVGGTRAGGGDQQQGGGNESCSLACSSGQRACR